MGDARFAREVSSDRQSCQRPVVRGQLSVVRMPVWSEVHNSTSQYSSTPNLEPIPGIICFGIERDANGYGIP